MKKFILRILENILKFASWSLKRKKSKLERELKETNELLSEIEK